jgi:hypothetical protein
MQRRWPLIAVFVKDATMSLVSRYCWAALALCSLLVSAAAADPPVPPVPPPPPGVPVLPPPEPVPLYPLPPWLPHYDLDIHLDLGKHKKAVVHQRVTWTNRHKRPAEEIIFNAHSHYKIPKEEVGLLAKTLEIMRLMPGDAMDFGDEPLQVQHAALGDVELPFHFQKENNSALVIPLPHPVAMGETIVIDLDYTLRLPEKQGRWGYFEGVTFLSNWLPVLAFYDDHGWQPTPFIPWHQPFFNEAGLYHVRVTLPCDQKIACSGHIVAEQECGDGTKQVEIVATGVRDFALLCSARYREYTGMVEAAPGVAPVRVKCLAFPEHAHYAKMMVRTACEVIPVYSRWFGPYPWGDFTFAESYFGWNGNECATLVMIDERVFGMPHLAEGYVEYLICHETCHQWWYNLLGTNGYCETWMDEAMANYFAHRWLNQKHGHNNKLLAWPRGLEWMPNIKRDSYRYYGLYGTLARGECCPVVQEMPKFKHVITLFSMCYDKGGKIVGMIEDRLKSEAAFLDFLHIVTRKYAYGIIRVADYQHELECYTGRSWEQFFQDWLYKVGISDWCIEKVSLERLTSPGGSPPPRATHFFDCLHTNRSADQPTRAVVLLHQKADYNEETVLGIRLHDGNGWDIRIPIMPQLQSLHLDNPSATVETLPDNRVRVVVDLPCRPVQMAVDPDQVLVDRDPSNNYWRPPVTFRVVPLYTFLEETSVTTDYDRWNVIAGPWFYGATWNDPWWTRGTTAGVRLGAYRTETFAGGVYAAYRSDYQDVVAGVEGLWDHIFTPCTQLGFVAEHRLAQLQAAESGTNRAAVYGRYVFQYGDSFYQAPMVYAEAFANYTDDFLPFERHAVSGAQRYDNYETAGLHYHVNYLTPYWDAEGGFWLDLSYQGGHIELDRSTTTHQVTGQFSCVKSMPDLYTWLEDYPRWSAAEPVLHWLSDTRWAFRLYGAAAAPLRGEFFSLGGDQLFRGFDLEERQGSVAWVGSVEWRVPLAERVTWDCLDHSVGVRNVYGAAFYDVGDAYVNGHSYGAVAHALGAGLRLDVAWLSFVERTILRFDVAKAVNVDTPVQFWFGLQHPF